MTWRFWQRDPRYSLDQAARILLANPLVGEDLKHRGFDWSDGVRELDQSFQKYLKYVGTFDDITACIGARAETAASVPLRVYETDGDLIENPPDHLASFLEYPNPDQGFAEFWEAAVWAYDLQGEAPFCGVLPNGEYELSENSEEFWVLRPSRIAPVYSERRRVGRESPELLGWSFGDIDTVRFPAESVALAKRHNPNDAIRGLSPVKKLELKLRLLLGALNSQTSYYANGAFPGLVVTSETQPTDPQRSAFEQKFKAQHVGVRNWGKALWLWASGLKVQRMYDTPKDALPIESIREARQAIRSEYRVPPLILADIENANRSNSEAQLEFFWRHSIMPTNRALLSRLNNSAMVPDGMRLAFDYSDVESLQIRRGEQMERAVRGYTEGLLTKNEAREIVGREPVDDGDEFKAKPSPPPMIAPPAPADDEEESDEDEDVELVGSNGSSFMRLRAGRRLEIDL